MMRSGYKFRAKSTCYDGNYFRSKLEARWAVFMDLLGVTYEYERDSAIVGAGFVEIGYCPDFFLEDLQLYVEIKPRKPNEIEILKAVGWADYTADVVFFYNLSLDNGIKVIGEPPLKPLVSLDHYRWCECDRCFKIDITEFGIPECGCYSENEFDMMYLGDIPEIDFSRTKNLIDAYKIAKNYNFSTSAKVMMLPGRRAY